MTHEKALAPGTVIQGEKRSYRVVDVLRVDGLGFAYKAVTEVRRGSRIIEVPTVVREHMMIRCSHRGPDGVTVVTPEDIAPTVDSCLEVFIQSSLERARISAECPWIINVLETFRSNNTYYYAVEFLDGDTLEDYVMKMGGSLTFEQARKVLAPIFDAVRILHANKAVHTDITPWHIRFVHRGDELIPVLFSLYASMHFNDKGTQQWSIPVMTCEEGYAPPEQYTSIEHFCPQMDIYSLAATLVYALSGRNLPDSRGLSEDVVRETLPPTVPENIVSAILNSLNSDPAVRTSTVTKFREDLGTFQGESANETSRSILDDDGNSTDDGYTLLSYMRENWVRLLIPLVMLGVLVALVASM